MTKIAIAFYRERRIFDFDKLRRKGNFNRSRNFPLSKTNRSIYQIFSRSYLVIWINLQKSILLAVLREIIVTLSITRFILELGRYIFTLRRENIFVFRINVSYSFFHSRIERFERSVASVPSDFSNSAAAYRSHHPCASRILFLIVRKRNGEHDNIGPPMFAWRARLFTRERYYFLPNRIYFQKSLGVKYIRFRNTILSRYL